MKKKNKKIRQEKCQLQQKYNNFQRESSILSLFLKKLNKRKKP